jgi:hypothetical protein
MIFYVAVYLPIVLLKSCDIKINMKVYVIPGIVDNGFQGLEFNVMMASYKKGGDN